MSAHTDRHHYPGTSCPECLHDRDIEVSALLLKTAEERDLALALLEAKRTAFLAMAREVRHEADSDHPDRGRLSEIADDLKRYAVVAPSSGRGRKGS
mgnify:FL=1